MVVAVLDHLRRMLSQHPSLTAIITGLSVPPRARNVAAGVLVYLIFGLVSAAAIAAFVATAEEVVGGGEMAVFDVAFGQALRRAGSPEWEEFFARVSRLGTPDVVFGATVAGAVALMVRGQLATASVWLASQAGTAVLVIVLKALFARTRPDFMDSAVETTWSFPSGHAMATLVLVAIACSVLLWSVRSWAVGWQFSSRSPRHGRCSWRSVVCIWVCTSPAMLSPVSPQGLPGCVFAWLPSTP